MFDYFCIAKILFDWLIDWSIGHHFHHHQPDDDDNQKKNDNNNKLFQFSLNEWWWWRWKSFFFMIFEHSNQTCKTKNKTNINQIKPELTKFEKQKKLWLNFFACLIKLITIYLSMSGILCCWLFFRLLGVFVFLPFFLNQIWWKNFENNNSQQSNNQTTIKQQQQNNYKLTKNQKKKTKMFLFLGLPSSPPQSPIQVKIFEEW